MCAGGVGVFDAKPAAHSPDSGPDGPTQQRTGRPILRNGQQANDREMDGTQTTFIGGPLVPHQACTVAAHAPIDEATSPKEPLTNLQVMTMSI